MPVHDRFIRYICFSLFLSVAILLTDNANASERYTFHHEHILGTSLEIQVEATSSSTASAAEQRVIDEINRLAQIYSHYDATSELRRWQLEIGKPTVLSPELFEVLSSCDRWQRRSHGAFNPAVQVLTELWRRAEQRGQYPSDQEIAAGVALVQQIQWTLNETGQTATRLVEGSLSLNAIAKGLIIDRACDAGYQKNKGILGMLVCIGGDLRIRGDLVQPIHIVDPANDGENSSPVATVHLHNRGLATSGNYRRGFKVNGEHYSHILDPRTGLPTSQIVSATVIAETAADADALATIFSVLSPAESAKLAEEQTGIDYLLIDRDGKQYSSPHWDEWQQPQLFRRSSAVSRELAFADNTDKEVQPIQGQDATNSKPTVVEKSKDSTPLELVVKFELNQPPGGQYRRPFVAIWLEDADEFPVRTAILWMQTKQPGPRWHRDLLRWYRNDGVRKLADGKELIGTVSGATRGPGEYKATFDGKDDAGNLLPAGKYTLYIEVAREHGTYQLIRHTVTLGDNPVPETKLKQNVEVKAASVEYRVPGVVKSAHGQ